MKVGVVMPISENDYAGCTATYTDLRDVAQAAETHGLNSIWVFDHLLFRFGDEPTSGIHEAWSMLAALAADTHRVEVGTLVLALPFRNPAVLAKMAATVDEISGGRLILGVGTGWHETEFEAFGIPFDHRVSRFDEALTILLGLLRDGHLDFAGTYHAAHDGELIPRGPRPGGIPILIAGKGPRMLGLVARHADLWNTAWLGSVEELAPRIARLNDALALARRDPSTLGVTVGANVVVPELVVGEDLPRSAISGDAPAIAQGLREFASAGVAHLIASLTPATPEAVRVLARAVALAREGDATLAS
jgi:probable F420-dependent oxidoreductase